MKKYKSRSDTDIVKLKICVYWIIFVLMIIYMIVVAELGLGDSRKMSSLADDVSRIIFFGGMIYVLWKISFYKKMIKNTKSLFLEMQSKQDERKKYLYLKSGGLVVDILICILLFLTCTLALCASVAFNTCLAILLLTIFLKMTSYFVYNKLY